ncbi:MAG: hypothetical protein QOI31_2100 [Solirubrobacterales bacterium]|nr:hypothetical protein [Solirubrobacterales bacterium]
MTTRILKALSLLVTVACLVGAFALGGEKPLSPAVLARHTNEARKNLAEAVDNAELTARRTAAFGDIARNVKRQLDSSRRLLAIQLELEDSSRAGSKATEVINDRLASLAGTLDSLRDLIQSLGGLSQRLGDVASNTVSGASDLTGRLDALHARFQRVIEESRELNRKARGFEKAGDTP